MGHCQKDCSNHGTELSHCDFAHHHRRRLLFLRNHQRTFIHSSWAASVGRSLPLYCANCTCAREKGFKFLHTLPLYSGFTHHLVAVEHPWPTYATELSHSRGQLTTIITLCIATETEPVLNMRIIVRDWALGASWREAWLVLRSSPTCSLRANCVLSFSVFHPLGCYSTVTWWVLLEIPFTSCEF